MNTKTSSLLKFGLSLLLVCPAFAATSVTYDFEVESNGVPQGDFFSDSVTGWSQDTTNPSAFGDSFPLAYIFSTAFAGGASTNTGHLGTQFANLPDNSSTTVSGVVDLPVTNALEVTLNLAIIDNTADAFAQRDAFSVALTNSASATIAQIDLTPTSGDDTSWDVSVGTGGAASATGSTITALNGYEFKIVFGATTNFYFGGAVQGAVIGLGPALPAVPGISDLDAIAMTHNPLGLAGSSANTLAFDNIVVIIPEPSSAILAALGFSFLGRRRRS